MSSFSWLDGSEQQRRRMLDVISLFREKETRDELGISAVRDAFADLFFPGTSTIQTRARYFLFIPWIYTELERKRVPSAKIGARARREEMRLIAALYDNGEREGLIGINAREALKRLPSAIYWQGLGAWGIRRYEGGLAAYHRSLDGFYAANGHTDQLRWENRGDDGEYGEAFLHSHHNWHPGVLALRPGDFPANATFDLTAGEAAYLQERIVTCRPGSLLAFLVAETGWSGRTGFPWQHPAWASFPPRLQVQLTHARLFSLAIHGAALLYNLMLAEQRQQNSGVEQHELVERYREWLGEWAGEMAQAAAALDLWDWHGHFWELVKQSNPHISWRTQQFVDAWLALAVDGDPATISANREARQLLRRRERFLKGKLARLHNPRALELWNGAAGTGRLDYRWGVTQTLLADILEGLGRA